MFGIWSKKFRIDTLIFLCSAQRKNMEIFLLPPAGFGGKFEFSLCAQTRTEKLLRGGKLGVAGYGQESLGQAFLKACRIQKDRVLCLHSETGIHFFSQLPKRSDYRRLAQQDPTCDPKKTFPHGKCLKGAHLRISEKPEESADFKSFRSTRAL